MVHCSSRESESLHHRPNHRVRYRSSTRPLERGVPRKGKFDIGRSIVGFSAILESLAILEDAGIRVQPLGSRFVPYLHANLLKPHGYPRSYAALSQLGKSERGDQAGMRLRRNAQLTTFGLRGKLITRQVEVPDTDVYTQEAVALYDALGMKQAERMTHLRVPLGHLDTIGDRERRRAHNQVAAEVPPASIILEPLGVELPADRITLNLAPRLPEI